MGLLSLRYNSYQTTFHMMSKPILNSFTHTHATGTIVGMDEAGYGAWFGPLAVAAVMFNEGIEDLMRRDKIAIRDSKTMAENVRRKSAKWIQEHAKWYKIFLISPRCVDKYSNLYCDMYAMTECINKAHPDATLALVDGSRFIAQMQINTHVETVVKGDSKFLQIAAASILAKVAHDEWMHSVVIKNASLQKYNFDSHKGYVNNTHVNAVIEHGITNLHRQCWKVTALADRRIKYIDNPISLPDTLENIVEFTYEDSLDFKVNKFGDENISLIKDLSDYF